MSMKTVFVSSTFKDMHFERDLIHERVMPKLNEISARYGDSVSFCDLRWGVNTGDLESEEGSKKVLTVCLDEIDRCRPYMVIIVGERYGWIPDGKLISEAIESKTAFSLEELELSVTALEIEYGALCNPEKMGHTLFYFREFEGMIPEGYGTEDAQHKEKLNQLKERIVKLTGGKIHTYKVQWNETTQRLEGVDAFADMLFEDLQGLLKKDWDAYNDMDPYEKDQKIQWEFARQKARQFSAREYMIDEYVESFRQGQHLLILKGGSGSGKSTLMSRLAERFQEEGKEVCLIFCGNTQLSNSVPEILKTMTYYLETKLSMEHLEEKVSSDGSDEKKSSEDDVMIWVDRLAEVIATYQKTQKKEIVFVLDAIDQLYMDELWQKSYYIPANLGTNVKMVISALEEVALPYKEEIRYVLPLSKEDKRDVILGITRYAGRELEACVIDKIMEKKSSNNPLYLSMLIQRLVMMNKSDFEEIVAHGDGMSAISAHQIEIVEAASDELNGVGVDILNTAAERIGGELVRVATQYIALSRYGLREKDLEKILTAKGIAWNSLDFSMFVKYMRSLFVMRDDGRLDFTHKNIREGYRNICENPKELHQQILEYLDSLPAEDKVRKNEIAYHCIGADDKEYFLEYMALFYKDDDAMESAAKVVKAQIMQDDGDWFLKLAAKEKTEDETIGLLSFMNYELDAEFKSIQEELETEARIYTAVIRMAENLYNELPTLQNGRRLARAYTNVGDVYDCLDDTMSREKAGFYYEQALELRRKLTLYEDAEENELRHLAAICNSLGDFYEDNEDQASLGMARKLIEEAFEIRKDLAVKNPKVYERANLAKSYYNMAWQFLNEHTMAGYRTALEYMKEAEAIYRSLEDEGQDRRQDLARLYMGISKVLLRMNGQEQIDLALNYLEKVLALRKRLYLEKGTSAARSQLANAYSELGDYYLVYGTQRDAKKAEEYYLLSLEMNMLLYEERKTLVSYSKVSTDYEDLSRFYVAQSGKEEIAKAITYAQKAVEIQREIYQKQTTSKRMDAYINSCTLLMQMLTYSERESDREKAIEIAKEIVCMRKELSEKLLTVASKVDLANAYLSLQDLSGELAEKEQCLQEAEYIYDQIIEENPHYQLEQKRIKLWNRWSDFYKTKGTKEDLYRALDYAKRVEELCRTNYKKYGTAKEKNNYVDACYRIAVIYTMFKDLESMKLAQKAYETLLMLTKELAEEYQSVVYKDNLVSVYLGYYHLFVGTRDLEICAPFEKYLLAAIQTSEEMTKVKQDYGHKETLFRAYQSIVSFYMFEKSAERKQLAFGWIEKMKALLDEMELTSQMSKRIKELRNDVRDSEVNLYLALMGEDNLKKALALQKEILAECDAKKDKGRYASVLYAMADTYSALGEEIELREQNAQEAVDVYRELYCETQLPVYLEKLISALRNLGYLVGYQSKAYQRGVCILEEALELAKTHANEVKTANAFSNVVGIFVQMIGLYKAYGDMVHLEKMLECCKEAEKYLQKYEAEQLDARSEKLMLMQRYGETYKMMSGDENLQKALQYYEKHNALSLELYEEKHTVDSYKDAAYSYECLGDVYLAMGDEVSLAIAKEMYAKEAAIYEEAHKKWGTRDILRSVAVCCEKEGDVLKKMSGQENLQAALKCYKKEWDIVTQLCAEVETLDMKRLLGIAAYKIGDCYRDMERTELLQEALMYYEQSVVLQKEVAEKTELDVELGYLQSRYEKIAGIYVRYGDEENYQKGIAIYEATLEIREELFKRSGVITAKQDWVNTIHNLTVVLAKLLKLKYGKASFEELESLAQRLISYFERIPKESLDASDYSNWSAALVCLGNVCLQRKSEEDQMNLERYLSQSVEILEKIPVEEREQAANLNMASSIVVLSQVYLNKGTEEGQTQSLYYARKAKEIFENLDEMSIMSKDNYWMSMYLMVRNPLCEGKVDLLYRMLDVAQELYDVTGNQRHAGFVNMCKDVLKIE